MCYVTFRKAIFMYFSIAVKYTWSKTYYVYIQLSTCVPQYIVRPLCSATVKCVSCTMLWCSEGGEIWWCYLKREFRTSALFTRSEKTWGLRKWCKFSVAECIRCEVPHKPRSFTWLHHSISPYITCSFFVSWFFHYLLLYFFPSSCALFNTLPPFMNVTLLIHDVIFCDQIGKRILMQGTHVHNNRLK